MSNLFYKLEKIFKTKNKTKKIRLRHLTIVKMKIWCKWRSLKTPLSWSVRSLQFITIFRGGIFGGLSWSWSSWLDIIFFLDSPLSWRYKGIKFVTITWWFHKRLESEIDILAFHYVHLRFGVNIEKEIEWSVILHITRFLYLSTKLCDQYARGGR